MSNPGTFPGTFPGKLPGSLTALLSLCLLLMCSATQAEIRIGLSSPADAKNSGIYVWAQAFAKELEHAGMSATIYPGSSLGTEIVRSEQVLLGLLEVNVAGSQEVEMYSDLVTALNLPFLLAGVEEADALFHQTNYLEEVNALTRPAGLRVVDLGTLGGMAGLFTTRGAIRSVADVKNFRLRAMSAEQLGWIEAWGGAGTQVAWEEVSQALQTGIADGYMNPPIVAVMFGHGAQLDYFTNLQMAPSLRIVVFSEKWYQGLSAGERKQVERALVVARQANRQWLKAAIANELQLLTGIGIEVIHPTAVERDSFRQLVIPTYTDMVSPSTLEKITMYLEQIRTPLDKLPVEMQE